MGIAVKLIVVLFILCIFSSLVIAVDQGTNPNLISSSAAGQTAQQQIAVELVAKLDGMENRIMKTVNDNNDANFRTLDERVKQYISDVKTKAILGILGLNLVVAGLTFYFINKHSKNFSYESVSMKRKKDAQDREFLAETFNYIKQKMDTMEYDMKNRYDPSLLTIQQLVEAYNKGLIQNGGYYQGQQQQGGGGANSGSPGGGGWPYNDNQGQGGQTSMAGQNPQNSQGYYQEGYQQNIPPDQHHFI
jgi:hypothetical protein